MWITGGGKAAYIPVPVLIISLMMALGVYGYIRYKQLKVADKRAQEIRPTAKQNRVFDSWVDQCKADDRNQNKNAA
ncbi:hypothetical protein [Loigolactobacillus bifermentans]|uniref:Uncharacterized protein n=1 Tax=Loigolactobacillus bifermentans DSM 20003 TaxID=1423726 RepID=A0A0R1GRD1_9LACO|nr:hypothetical protein [Loigolactobacillus bifermentans]KRK34401.1 hypothetical protein FC07_GL000610 [Loigolactobacillus bifermentans DSM 20003]QGG60109.1 hypothetical protein LB003_06390 [Loigolactobacillus bifermentans]